MLRTLQSTDVPRSKRQCKPTRKVLENQALAKESASNYAGNKKAYNAKVASRINRTKPSEQLQKCNFNDPLSINEHFPPHKGKGSFNPPVWLVNQAKTDSAKASKVREWRMLTTNQQKQRIEQHKEKEAAELALSTAVEPRVL